MRRVMVVDDEPVAVNLIKTVIEKKCANFKVVEIAYDGIEALEKIEKCHPDVLICDIQMPMMNGLKLVENCSTKYPEILNVVVSGYQEFEYVKDALRFGAVDYILKPIVPSEMSQVFERLERRLNQIYSQMRNRLMYKMVNDIPVTEDVLRHYFQAKKYYGSIVRLKGLPSRFEERYGKKVYSDVNEWAMVYGRDSQETCYLWPAEIFPEGGKDYVEMIRRRIDKEQPDAAYTTTIIIEEPVDVAMIGSMVKNLYRILDSSLVLGKSQIIILKDVHARPVELVPDRNFEYLQELELLAKTQDYDRLRHEVRKLLRKWGKEEHPQIWMESRIRQICYLLQRYGIGNEDYRECEFLLDETLSNLENVEELVSCMEDIMFKNMTEEDNPAMQKLNTEQYFQKIKDYIRLHMVEPLSLSLVSREMGVSQTYLSKLFRKYEDTTFGNYLTSLRMEKAKEILRGKERVFVKDVAAQVGYKDQFYFSRIFYSYTGVRPSEYVEKE